MLFGSDKANPTHYEGPRTAGAIESYALSQLDLNMEAPEVVELVGQVFTTTYIQQPVAVLRSIHPPHFSKLYCIKFFTSIILKMIIASFNCRMCWTKSVGLLRSVSSHFYLTFWTPKLKVATSTSQLCRMLQRSTKPMLTGKTQLYLLAIIRSP